MESNFQVASGEFFAPHPIHHLKRDNASGGRVSGAHFFKQDFERGIDRRALPRI
jgi:hypothetical protein